MNIYLAIEATRLALFQLYVQEINFHAQTGELVSLISAGLHIDKHPIFISSQK